MLSEWELRTRGGFPLGVLSPGEDGVKSRLGRPFVKCYPTAKLDDCHFQHQPHALGLAGLERPPQRKCFDRDRLPGSPRWFATLLYFSDNVWLNHILTKLGLTWAVIMTSFKL